MRIYNIYKQYISIMLKLIRNTLGDKKKLVDGNGPVICWKRIVNLYNIQESKGLYAANKLKISHI